MTGKERFLKTLRFEEPDRPPHFESMFELEYEAFGLRFPGRTAWEGCSPREKEQMIAACIEIYACIVDAYAWDALAVYWPWSDPDGVIAAKKVFSERIAIGGKSVVFSRLTGIRVISANYPGTTVEFSQGTFT